MVEVAPYSHQNRIATVSSGVSHRTSHRVFIKMSDKAPLMCCGRFRRRTAMMIILTFTMFGLVALVGGGASLVKYI